MTLSFFFLFIFFFCTQLNGFKYCFITVTIQYQLFIYKQFVGNFIFELELIYFYTI